jgi:uncharacterized protein (DUF433 family)
MSWRPESGCPKEQKPFPLLTLIRRDYDPRSTIFEPWMYNRRVEVSMTKAHIESNPAVMMGKPVIAGTRVTVESILERLGQGESMEQILEAHPRLKQDDILAALEFAAHTLRGDVIYPVADKAA